MKRDMDLIRNILFEVEKLPYDDNVHEISIPDKTSEEVGYHIKILLQAGLIEAQECPSMDDMLWYAKSLTWAGHEFLEASKDPGRWNKAKDLVNLSQKYD